MRDARQQAAKRQWGWGGSAGSRLTGQGHAPDTMRRALHALAANITSHDSLETGEKETLNIRCV